MYILVFHSKHGCVCLHIQPCAQCIIGGGESISSLPHHHSHGGNLTQETWVLSGTGNEENLIHD